MFRAVMMPDTKLTPGRALVELKAQHDALRDIMDRCEELADELDARGDVGPLTLTLEVARLRQAFDEHNKFEEQLLRPVLLEGDAFAEARIDRMVEDHVGEHRAMRAQMAATETSELRDVIEMLRAHLDAEERYLLTARVLHDDVVSVESAG
jgi:iron-sulfur cluster repair protein YtfE (RIC family)